MQMKTKLALAFSLATVLVIGQMAFASGPNESDGMGDMMNGNGMSGMMQMMENENMNKMMDAMNSPEGQAMMKACSKFMESYGNNERSGASKSSL
ncbi:hypothetical protein BSNK01_22900 [Bacillaceae bacterium]